MPFQLRAEHLRVLSRALQLQAEDDLVDHCFEEFPALCGELGEDEVVRLVKRGIAKAAALGFDTYPDVLTMVELTVEFGEHFEDEEPWAVPIWESNNPPARKLAILAAAASEEKIRILEETPDA